MGFDDEVSKRVQYLIAHHHTYDQVDGIDYQILIEADFLVNIMEDHLSKEAAKKAYETIFKTECGKTICRKMFGILWNMENNKEVVSFMKTQEMSLQN